MPVGAGRGSLPTADGWGRSPPPRIYRRCSLELRRLRLAQKCPTPEAASPGRCQPGAAARCQLRGSLARPLVAGRGRRGSEKPEPGAAGPGGAPAWGAELRAQPQRSRRVDGGASSAVLCFTSKGPACVSARLRRKERRAAVRLGLPVQVHPRVTEGKGGERGKGTPCPAPGSAARPRPGPSGLPRPGPRLQPRHRARPGPAPLPEPVAGPGARSAGGQRRGRAGGALR